MSANDDYVIWAPACSDRGVYPELGGSPGEQKLEVCVIFTEMPGTRAALHTAEALAQRLSAYIRLLVPVEVPYALPLTEPAVPVQFLQGQMRNLASEIRLEVAAHICLCRDKRRALNSLLRPQRPVVIGGKKHWWPTREQRLAQALAKNGYEVIFAELR